MARLSTIPLLWTLSAFSVLASGCAFTDITTDLPLIIPAVDFTGGEERVLILQPITDNREFTDRIGMKKNGYGQDTADVFSNKSVLPWLHERLTTELKTAGFQVTTEESHPTGVEVNGSLLKLFIEPVIQWSTVDHEADFSIKMEVKRPDGLHATRTYYVKSINQGLIASEGHYSEALNKATNTLMKRVVADLINLLNKYSQTRNQSTLRCLSCEKLGKNYA